MRSTIDEVRDRLRIMGGLPKIRTPGAQTGDCARRRATITAWPVSGDGPISSIAHRDRAIAKPSTKLSTRDVHGAANTVDRMHRRTRSRWPGHEDSRDTPNVRAFAECARVRRKSLRAIAERPVRAIAGSGLSPLTPAGSRTWLSVDLRGRFQRRAGACALFRPNNRAGRRSRRWSGRRRAATGCVQVVQGRRAREVLPSRRHPV